MTKFRGYLLALALAFLGAWPLAAARAETQFFPNIGAIQTGTDVGGKKSADVYVSGGALSLTEQAIAASGGSLPAQLKIMGGYDGSAVRPIKTDSRGVVQAQLYGRTAVDKARNDYSSTSVTTSAYVALKASLAGDCNEVEVFDSSGQTLLLATGGSGSETDQVYIVPGGNGRIPLRIAAGTRVSVKAVSGTASAGEIDLNFYQ